MHLTKRHGPVPDHGRKRRAKSYRAPLNEIEKLRVG